ncbi:hypothetical protein SNOG_00031 [Parastagonospora nodorum SN15]|uniref:Zn(2)-C6 fungal-type domain-containing protein n=1 Tax=Phaeosphaeria nodorum (strain SN15 / ATCC MYA-4574 / FGSC 10173) TaxID=321614 RepID=Q0V7I3_PHANO|nr:hypothetical protein SNOG_00031 [Parastagonospora nodorum SN15]EAT91526.1 hypothetical protein SNOG_00031 [Parastagonospora nodorum SN15]
MRKTLRRSCNLCAKSKLRCDLLLPQCSRCQKKSPHQTICLYANTPLSSVLTESGSTCFARSSLGSYKTAPRPIEQLQLTLSNPGTEIFDPFDSYPQTRLPRAHVQRLIQHFLSTIAFQYYPLDLKATSNPFVVSWFPLALADPALFHVSLQTASLDVELRACQGFSNSDILMADSVHLVRLKIDDPFRAVQDETIDSVVTLAAIEFGKGNTDISQTHIEGIKSMVRLRGGIHQVKLSPQFATQDESGHGDGIAPTPLWQAVRCHPSVSSLLYTLDLDPGVNDILCRLQMLFHEPEQFPMCTTEFHDLICFVLHRLLEPNSESRFHDNPAAQSTSECVRFATALYLLIVHGPTYFSHAGLQYKLTTQLKAHLENYAELFVQGNSNDSLALWILSIGMVATSGMPDYQWFTNQLADRAFMLGSQTWEDALSHVRNILWIPKQQIEDIFQRHWQVMRADAVG